MNELFFYEEDLVRGLKDRNPAALRVLYDRYAATLLGLASTILKDKDCSGAIIQDIFLAIWNAIDEYDPAKGRLFTWMFDLASEHALVIYHTQTLTYVNENPDQSAGKG